MFRKYILILLGIGCICPGNSTFSNQQTCTGQASLMDEFSQSNRDVVHVLVESTDNRCTLSPKCPGQENRIWGAQEDVDADLALEEIRKLNLPLATVPVAVVDTGFDKRNLKRHMSHKVHFPNIKVDQRKDAAGHGTAVSGLIGGKPPIGIAPNAEIFSYSISDKNGNLNLGYVGPQALALDLCRKGYKSINLSLEHDAEEFIADEIVMSDFFNQLKQEGCLIFKAAGNDGNKDRSTEGKDSKDSYLHIAAVSRTLTDTHFSDAGELKAPGEDVTTLLSAHAKHDPAKSCGPSHLAQISGTSFAAPIAAGIDALATGILLNHSGYTELTNPEKVEIRNHILKASETPAGIVNALRTVWIAKELKKYSAAEIRAILSKTQSPGKLQELLPRSQDKLCKAQSKSCFDMKECTHFSRCIDEKRRKMTLCGLQNAAHKDDQQDLFFSYMRGDHLDLVSGLLPAVASTLNEDDRIRVQKYFQEKLYSENLSPLYQISYYAVYQKAFGDWNEYKKWFIKTNFIENQKTLLAHLKANEFLQLLVQEKIVSATELLDLLNEPTANILTSLSVLKAFESIHPSREEALRLMETFTRNYKVYHERLEKSAIPASERQEIKKIITGLSLKVFAYTLRKTPLYSVVSFQDQFSTLEWIERQQGLTDDTLFWLVDLYKPAPNVLEKYRSFFNHPAYSSGTEYALLSALLDKSSDQPELLDEEKRLLSDVINKMKKRNPSSASGYAAGHLYAKLALSDGKTCPLEDPDQALSILTQSANQNFYFLFRAIENPNCKFKQLDTHFKRAIKNANHIGFNYAINRICTEDLSKSLYFSSSKAQLNLLEAALDHPLIFARHEVDGMYYFQLGQRLRAIEDYLGRKIKEKEFKSEDYRQVERVLDKIIHIPLGLYGENVEKYRRWARRTKRFIHSLKW